MIDFSTLQGLSIPEGVVTQIQDASGVVLWEMDAGIDGTFAVKKITSNTYVGETLYTDEQFILLDIYPKTNGTVYVTYEGVTKTITDTSGAEEPNAQQVFFGTFGGVSDEMETPESGIVTITGDLRGAGCSAFKTSKTGPSDSKCITAIGDLNGFEIIPDRAFFQCTEIASVKIPNGVTKIGTYAFNQCSSLTSIHIPESVTSIGEIAFLGCSGLTSITVASTNTAYYSSGNCLIETATHTLISGCMNSVIPESVTSIGNTAFTGCSSLTSIIIPESVTSIGVNAFSSCSSLTNVTFNNTSGWYVTKTSGGDASTGTAVDVTDTANNATLIVDTYRTYYWYRS